jgi:hypothetical protein
VYSSSIRLEKQFSVSAGPKQQLRTIYRTAILLMITTTAVAQLGLVLEGGWVFGKNKHFLRVFSRDKEVRCKLSLRVKHLNYKLNCLTFISYCGTTKKKKSIIQSTIEKL